MNTPRRMIPFTALACIGLVGFAGPRWSVGQTAPAATDTPASHSSAQSEAGEPRATTSPDAPSATAENPGQAADARVQTAPDGRRSQSAKAGGKAQGGGKPEGGGKAEVAAKTTATDKLELQTATVTGDREQPKVMYIVPWKKSDIGDLSGKPMNSLLDEALAPVDRDEFKREVMYYQAVRADASQNGAAPAGAAPAGAAASGAPAHPR
jgi:hypothetical protein